MNRKIVFNIEILQIFVDEYYLFDEVHVCLMRAGKAEMDVSTLIEIIQNNDIVVYGTGYAARNFYTALQIRHLDKRIDCFIVTDPDKAQGNINGIPIRLAEKVIDNGKQYICIAVHSAIKCEIEKYLLEHNVNKYIWVHPYIMELALGTIVEHHKMIETRRIIQSQSTDNYAVAIRYLAIENYYKKNNIGYEIYLKALYLQCEKETAYKRLNKFIELIDDWDKNGYLQEKDIWIDEKYRLIDGTHRLSLASYHKMEKIYCDIFPYSSNYSKIIKVSHFLNRQILIENGFSKDELEILEKVQKIMRV